MNRFERVEYGHVFQIERNAAADLRMQQHAVARTRHDGEEHLLCRRVAHHQIELGLGRGLLGFPPGNCQRRQQRIVHFFLFAWRGLHFDRRIQFLVDLIFHALPGAAAGTTRNRQHAQQDGYSLHFPLPFLVSSGAQITARLTDLALVIFLALFAGLLIGCSVWRLTQANSSLLMFTVGNICIT